MERIIDESGDKKYFTIIPNYILNHSTLWDREVYIQMKRIAGEDGTCWTSQKNLAKQCGISVNRLKKSIKYLIEHEWITYLGGKEVLTKGGSQEVNEYRIADLWKKNIEFYENERGVSQDDTPRAKGVSRLSPKGYHQKATNKNQVKEEPIYTQKDQFSILEDKIDTITDSELREEIQAFVDYWREKSPNGKKEKWQMERTFDIRRRLNTWFRNKQAWSKKGAGEKDEGYLEALRIWKASHPDLRGPAPQPKAGVKVELEKLFVS